MFVKSPLFNTLMLLLALLVVTQRAVTPFVVAPIQVHANGYIEICSWYGGFEQRSQPLNYCPACIPAFTLSSFTDLAYLTDLAPQALPFTIILNQQTLHPNLLSASPRAPPLAS